MLAVSLLAALKPLLGSKALAALVSAIVPSVVGSAMALLTYRLQSKEPLSASITWQWTSDLYGRSSEEPFLTIQNRSGAPAYLKRARLLRGLTIRFVAARYAFSYDEMEEGSFPLELRANGASSFPLSRNHADRILSGTWWLSRLIAYLTKRDYLWVEVTTIGGRRLVVKGNDIANFVDRPLWIDGRWLPDERSGWHSALATPNGKKPGTS